MLLLLTLAAHVKPSEHRRGKWRVGRAQRPPQCGCSTSMRGSLADGRSSSGGDRAALVAAAAAHGIELLPEGPAGRGASGVVYRARAVRSGGRVVAVKCIDRTGMAAAAVRPPNAVCQNSHGRAPAHLLHRMPQVMTPPSIASGGPSDRRDRPPAALRPQASHSRITALQRITHTTAMTTAGSNAAGLRQQS